MDGTARRAIALTLVMVVAFGLFGLLVLEPTTSARAATAAQPLPDGFTEHVMGDGYNLPTAIRFTPDGKMFVAEKDGIVKVVDDPLHNSTPRVFADLTTDVFSYLDRGLAGLAIDPKWPARPYVYVAYTRDADIGGVSPKWGTPGVRSDNCPTPPGPTTDGCVVSSRLLRLTMNAGGVADPGGTVLLDGWCQQGGSHTTDNIQFDSEGALYVSAGDGAMYTVDDYGQTGGSLPGTPTPANPCGDPPGGVGTALTAPTAEGGSLRSQSFGRPASEPAAYNGTVLRVNPDTGAPVPDNPAITNPDPARQRIVAYGLRNPYRMAFRPGSDELWIGDVGRSSVEELDRVNPVQPGVVPDFGWPCYEGPDKLATFQSFNQCKALYNTPGSTKAASYYYYHGGRVTPDETDASCPTGTSAIAGLTFYTGNNYPAIYKNAIFFGDYGRQCIYYAPAGADGRPDFTQAKRFHAAAFTITDLQVGPDGNLWWVNIGGKIRRITYQGPDVNHTPVAAIAVDRQHGTLPLTVNFDGSTSTDPDPGDQLSYSWDLNGDGVFGDSTAAKPTRTYTVAGDVTVSLRVTDPGGLTSTTSIVVTPGLNLPSIAIDTPTSDRTWKVGDLINFSGHATDADGNPLPASDVTWHVILHHCTQPGNCHIHALQDFAGITAGSLNAPDHEYPSYLELQAVVTDANNLSATASVSLQPQTTQVTINSSPGHAVVTYGETTAATPFTVTVIRGHADTLSAPTTATIDGTAYNFGGWSDGKDATHNVTVNDPTASFDVRYDYTTDPWTFETADGTSTANGRRDADLGGGASTVLWRNKEHTIYCDLTNGVIRDGTYSAATGAGTPSTYSAQTIDGQGGGNGRIKTKISGKTSVVLYRNNPQVFYYDEKNNDLRHAWYDKGAWNAEVLDGGSTLNGRTKGGVGQQPTALLVAGQLNVFYRAVGVNNLRRGWYDGSRWRFETLDGAGGTNGRVNGSVAGSISAVDFGGRPDVFYSDETNGRLRHAWSDGTQWQFESLDGVGGPNGQITGLVGTQVSATIAGDVPQVFYSDSTNNDLRHAWWTGANWNFDVIDGDNWDNGHSPYSTGADPHAFTLGNGRPEVWYRGPWVGNLRHAWWDGTHWRAESFDGASTAGGREFAGFGDGLAAVDDNGRTQVWYYDQSHGDLRHATRVGTQ